MPKLLGEHRLVGDVAVTRPGGHGGGQHRTAESLRRLREPDLFAWNGRRHDPARQVDALDGIAHRHRRHGRAGLFRRGDDAIDERPIGERPRGVVHEHDLRSRRQRGEARPDRVLASLAAGHHHARTRRRPDERRGLLDQIRRQHDDHLTDPRMAVKGFDAAPQDRPATKIEELLRERASHARAATGRDDDHPNRHRDRF